MIPKIFEKEKFIDQSEFDTHATTQNNVNNIISIISVLSRLLKKNARGWVILNNINLTSGRMGRLVSKKVGENKVVGGEN